MKTRSLAIVAASLLALSACKEDKAVSAAPAANSLETQAQKVSYILGMNIGNQFKANEVPFDQASFVAGIQTSIEGKEPKLNQQQIQETMLAFQGEMQKKQEAREAAQKAELAKQGEANKKAGDEFLAQNGKRQGVITTKSGLQYEILTEGKGKKPTENDNVTVHYRGTLLDGTEFDSSYKRNEPASFAVNAVIPGWVEALQLMPEGSKWKIYLPADLAYGPGGTGGAIGPNATLIFEVELLKVGGEQPAAEATAEDATEGADAAEAKANPANAAAK